MSFYYLVEHMEAEWSPESKLSPWVSLEYQHMQEVLSNTDSQLVFTNWGETQTGAGDKAQRKETYPTSNISTPSAESINSSGKKNKNVEFFSACSAIATSGGASEDRTPVKNTSTEESPTSPQLLATPSTSDDSSPLPNNSTATTPTKSPLYLHPPLSHFKPNLDWSRVCLLDMKASLPLTPEDTEQFDVIVLGGILGNITHEDDGTYGSDDRTAELRDELHFQHRRHLGQWQMTTDTALLVSKLVVEHGIPLEEIPYVDEPEVDVMAEEMDEDESCSGPANKRSEITQMEGFRYVAKQHPSDGDWFEKLHGMKKSNCSLSPESTVSTSANTSSPLLKGLDAEEQKRFIAMQNSGEEKIKPILPRGMIRYWRESADNELDADDILWWEVVRSRFFR